MDPKAQRTSPLRRSARLSPLSPGDASGRSPAASAQSGTHVIGTLRHSARPPALVAPPKPVKKTLFTERLHTATLSGVAGFVEASAFLALFGLFPAHITGALVWATASTTAPTEQGLMRLTIIPVFVFAVFLAAVAARLERKRSASPLPLLMSLMTFSLATFCAAGVVLGRFATSPDALAVTFISAAGVFAMGIQNAVMREALSGLCLTTMMTGNLTQLVIEGVNFVFVLRESTPQNRAEALHEARQRMARFGAPVSGFLGGALGGAYFTHTFGLVSIALPTFVCAGLAALAFRTYR